MLKLRYKESEDASPIQQVCPWLDFINPEMVLCKDGSLLVGFEFDGIDVENATSEHQNAVANEIQRAYQGLDGRDTLMWVFDKKRSFDYPKNNFNNSISKTIDDLYSKPFREGYYFTFANRLYYLYTGKVGVARFMDTFARETEKNGKNALTALLLAAKDSMSGRISYEIDARQIMHNIEQFERRIAQFLVQTPSIKWRRLGYEALTKALSEQINPASIAHGAKKPFGQMLDAWLPNNTVTPGKEQIRFDAAGRTKFMSVIGIKEWPNLTHPDLLGRLMEIDTEVTVCQTMRFLGHKGTHKKLNDAVDFYKLTQVGLIKNAISKLTKKPPEPDPGKYELYAECVQALTRLETDNIQFGYHTMTVCTSAESKKELDQSVEDISTVLSRDFQIIVESMNAFASWAATLPGQWAMQSRWSLVSNENLADTTSVFTINHRPKNNAAFEEMLGEKANALCVFNDIYGGVEYFNSHVGQVGHAVIIAPTGGGKTTLVNLALSQFQKYTKDGKDPNTIVFDRDYSVRITAKLQDATHIDLKSGGIRINPLMALFDDDASENAVDQSDDSESKEVSSTTNGFLWCRDFVGRRIESNGYKLTAEDIKSIDDALLMLKKSPAQKPRLSKLAILLPKHLSSELGEWLEGRPFGMFDSEVDEFSLSSFTCIEMKEFLANERLAQAFLDYAFRKVYSKLDGRPTFIYIEEASFLLNHPTFQKMLDDWLKTFRKKGAFVWMALQSPTSIVNAEIAASITDNVKTKILLFNKSVEAHREAYKKYFGLSDYQVDRIVSLVQKRDYYIISDGDARTVQTQFSKECLAYLRSEEYLQNIFNATYNPSDSGWKQKYIEKVLG
jgi:type IV secretion system protein VirB4